jgi:MSHA pilin protein MshA
MNGLAGAIRSSVALVQSRYVVSGDNTSTTVVMSDGTNVTVAAGTGIPTAAAAGIGNALTYEGFALAGGVFNFTTAVANCNVTYVAATGQATVDTTGC